MIVKVLHFGSDYEAGVELDIRTEDGKLIGIGYAGDFSGSPEDANLVRALAWVDNIPSWLKRAYVAGERGEPFSVVHEGDDEA